VQKIREVIKNYLSFVGQLLWAFTALNVRKIFMGSNSFTRRTLNYARKSEDKIV
jgi:hypothetical protein